MAGWRLNDNGGFSRILWICIFLSSIYQHISKIFLPTVFFILSNITIIATAETISPSDVRNNNPFIHIFGLPYIGDAEVLAPGRQSYSIQYDVSNIYAFNSTNNEQLFMDGEISYTQFKYKLGVGGGNQWELVIPYIRHSGGTLDGFIDGWHRIFGLPESGRDTATKNQLRYYYQRDGKILIDFTDASSGIGDIQITSTWQLKRITSPNEDNTAVSISLKLPTGDSTDLLGSGAADLTIYAKREQATRFFDFRSGLFYSGGLSLLGDSDVLTEIQDNLVLFGGIGGGIFFSNQVVLKSQLDIHTPVYSKSDLRELDEFAAQFTLAVSVEFGGGTMLDMSVSEDLMIDGSPDVTFHSELRYRF